MRHTILVAIAGLLLTACSVIDREDRLEEIIISGTVTPNARNILIEDYTGQHCPNCPTATEVIETLTERYARAGIKLVSVGLHSGGTGVGTPLYTDDAQYYFNLLGDPSLPQPAVRVNRASEILTGGPTVQNRLPGIIETYTHQQTSITIGQFSVEDKGEAGINLDFALTSLQDEDVRVQAWLIEDNIVSLQSLPDGSTTGKYTHKAVMRKAVSSLQGDDVTLKENTPAPCHYTFTAKKSWKYADMSLVVIVSNPAGEMLQVDKFPFENN